MPWRRLEEIIQRKKEWFIPFVEITAIHPNTNLDLKYITIIGPGMGSQVIEKDFIDLDEFVEALKLKVKVVTDYDMRDKEMEKLK